jgi:hypothetical protein
MLQHIICKFPTQNNICYPCNGSTAIVRDKVVFLSGSQKDELVIGKKGFNSLNEKRTSTSEFLNLYVGTVLLKGRGEVSCQILLL